VAQPFDPWETLAELVDAGTVVFEQAEIDGGELGFIERYKTHWRIVIDDRLTAREKRCVLAHELMHLSRSRVMEPWCPSQLEEVEELRVEMETAGQLVPPRELLMWATQTLATGGGVTLEAIEDRFDVTHDVALAALSIATSPWVSGYGLLRALGENLPLAPIPPTALSYAVTDHTFGALGRAAFTAVDPS